MTISDPMHVAALANIQDIYALYSLCYAHNPGRRNNAYTYHIYICIYNRTADGILSLLRHPAHMCAVQYIYGRKRNKALAKNFKATNSSNLESARKHVLSLSLARALA